VAETQAVFYRDKRGVEPVDDFVESLPDKPAAKIDGYVEEYLNGRPADAPPPEFPVTSQIDGEYAAIRELREKNWIAAHIRERRYELDLTQREVAEQAGTSHSFISKLEAGDHIPTIPVLKRILAVLDEELLIGIERRLPDEEPEREVAPVPELAGA
jgi:DNA-binding XRE family transcriptional regulator